MQKFGKTKKLITGYFQYEKYYDQNRSAKPTPEQTLCSFLIPQFLEQSTVIASQNQEWLSLYKVEKALPESNYIIQKVNTNWKQCVHRIRWKPTKPIGTLK